MLLFLFSCERQPFSRLSFIGVVCSLGDTRGPIVCVHAQSLGRLVLWSGKPVFVHSRPSAASHTSLSLASCILGRKIDAAEHTAANFLILCAFERTVFCCAGSSSLKQTACSGQQHGELLNRTLECDACVNTSQSIRVMDYGLLASLPSAFL